MFLQIKNLSTCVFYYYNKEAEKKPSSTCPFLVGLVFFPNRIKIAKIKGKAHALQIATDLVEVICMLREKQTREKQDLLEWL